MSLGNRFQSTLDEKTKNELSNLSIRDSSLEVSHAFCYNIIGYGIRAVAHVCIMYLAQEVALGKISVDDFCKKYEIKLPEEANRRYESNRLMFPLRAIEEEGAFFPKCAYKFSNRDETYDRQITLFDADNNAKIDIAHGNLFNIYGKYDSTVLEERDCPEYLFQLMHSKWEKDNLQKSQKIEEGIQFSRDLWKGSMMSYRYEQGKKDDPHRQPDYITELSEKLIGYYENIFSEILIKNSSRKKL
ncbi:MAG: hypothetical protein Q7K43_00695 [Candidatus Woesearchaeota archaeon]|nr:hypothetical protein [Candidatus Woesearchaeota archaeon]